MMDPSAVPTREMDFSSFVLDLNQSPKIDSGMEAGNHRCCAPESRLSAEFENKMQKLITNFDLDDDLEMPAMRFSDPEPVLNEEMDGTILADRDYHVESLDTTVDNEDDPLNLTADDCDDSGDAGCSSDEQQQESRSVSLSYSLSISHAQENFSQYSQSTGLSKRYDSPCSYEDDRESECTNFDKLDDWSDLINDLHNNNNNNVDAANREFKEYLDDFLGKDQQAGGSTSGVETSEEGTNDTKEPESFCEEEQKMTEENQIKLVKGSSRGIKDSRPDTPALERKAKCHNYLDYRDPGLSDFDDDAMGSVDDNSNVVKTSEGVAVFRQHGFSVKRKLCEDYEDREQQLELIVEKFQKTDIVPDHGQHAPISATCCSMDDVENQTDDEKLVMLDGEEDASNSPVATTPTNPRNMHRLFLAQTEETLEQLVSQSDCQLFMQQQYRMKLTRNTRDLELPVTAGSSRKVLKLPLTEQQ